MDVKTASLLRKNYKAEIHQITVMSSCYLHLVEMTFCQHSINGLFTKIWQHWTDSSFSMVFQQTLCSCGSSWNETNMYGTPTVSQM